MANFTTNAGSNGLSTNGGTISWTGDTIKVRLVASSFTPNKDDTSMTGYTGIGSDQTLGSKTVTVDTTNDRLVYDGADSTFPTVAGGSTIGWIVHYKFVTNDAGSTPIFIMDITDTATSGVDIVVTWPAAGIAYTQQ